ncbi:MAG: hypothetical protein Q9220_004326 [cf. Caloplaca sp. 1 TL-2023]
MPPVIPKAEDEDYDSAADSDFGGSLSPSSGDDSSASEGQATKGPKSKDRKKRTIEDSGDEGVVKEGKKKRRKKTKAGQDGKEEGTEESAIGMRVRERKLGRAAEQEKKPLASSKGATVDVDALWARLNSTGSKPPATSQTKGGQDEQPTPIAKPSILQESLTQPLNGDTHHKKQASSSPLPPEDTITIKRTYVFAGETITEEKAVPKTSAEARLYLQSQATQASSPISPKAGKPLRRPKKRPSMFEPNPEGTIKGLAPTPKTGPKLNTIEKSKLDWASHVDKEGLKEELDVAEKAKGGYMGRMEFLGRTEAKREEDLKSARTK